LPHLHVIGYADLRVLVFCKLGGTVKKGARNYLIKETITQVILQAVLNLLWHNIPTGKGNGNLGKYILQDVLVLITECATVDIVLQKLYYTKHCK
jgi:hypothetical protein